MTTAPDRLLLRLEWRVIRRLDGRLQGGYRTAYRGSGMDFAGLRPYVDGDDARHIDWNVTARLDEPQVRRVHRGPRADGVAGAGPVGVDAVGGPGRGKHDVLAELALILARLLGRGGNRVGAVLYDTGQTRDRAARDRARPGPAHRPRARPRRRQPRDRRDHRPRRDARRRRRRWPGAAAWSSSSPTSSATASWERPLLRLAHRHEVVALRVVDAADDALPEVGLIVVEDAETGEQLLVDSSDPLFRARFADGVDEREAVLEAGHAARRGAAAPDRHRRRPGRARWSRSSPRPSGGAR